MASDLAGAARQNGIKYFLISFTDLFGVQRSKLVPATAINDMAKIGAGFAGFATWLDMTPADSDMFAIPDAARLIQLPWKPEVGWLPADIFMNGQPVAHGPRGVLKKLLNDASKLGYEMKTGVECEFFLLSPDGGEISDTADAQALLRSASAHAPLRRDIRDLRRDACAWLEAVSKRP
jgi:glutamine synthetase